MLKNIHRHTRFSLLIFTTFLILLVGCKKEKDTHIPVITYYSPQHNQAFNVLDTVLVEALITDQKMITSVKVNLTNEEFITVSEARSFSPNTNSYELKTKLAIDDEALESGTYYVLIRADNGDNFKNKYQQILIQGTEQEFVQLLAVTDGGFMTLKVMGSADQIGLFIVLFHRP